MALTSGAEAARRRRGGRAAVVRTWSKETMRTVVKSKSGYKFHILTSGNVASASDEEAGKKGWVYLN